MKSIQSWLDKQCGIPLTWLLIWASYSAIITIVSAALSLRLLTIFFSMLIVGIAVWALLKLKKSVDSRRKLTKQEFAIIKKALSYFAFIQFAMNSINLIVAWSGEHIEMPLYYLLYLLVVIGFALYLPVYLPLNKKKNLQRLGLLKSVKKNGQQKYIHVKLFPGIGPAILSWVDALIWAVVMVIFINSLIFQLYQIPSESMVPEHYVGSRVVATKTLTNPEIPLSLVSIPVTAGINRFDQIVLNNPRYQLPRSYALQEFWDKVLFMISFTAIQKPKVDVNGVPFEDPLIKRLIGEPGDQLMMVDDVVYIRNNLTGDFRELTEDQKYALNFFTNLPVNKNRIEVVTVSEPLRSEMLAWDAEKKTMDDVYAGKSQAFADYFASFTGKTAGLVISNEKLFSAVSIDKADFRIIAQQDPTAGYFHAKELTESDLAAYALLAARHPSDFLASMDAFLNSGTSAQTDANAYDSGTRETNLLFKVYFLDTLEAFFKALSGDSSSGYADKLSKLNSFIDSYIYRYFDKRNFAPYPDNALLGKSEYFFMGDNRYNSLDSRYLNNTRRFRRLDENDPYSIIYQSNIEPFITYGKDIRGKAVLGIF